MPKNNPMGYMDDKGMKETKGHNSKDDGGAYGASGKGCYTEQTSKRMPGNKGENSKKEGKAGIY